jgi:hypothetical protein
MNEAKALESMPLWKARGDQYHWDHSDGSFIERDFGTGIRYVLYSDDCARLGSFRTLIAAGKAHAALGTDKEQPTEAKPHAGGKL